MSKMKILSAAAGLAVFAVAAGAITDWVTSPSSTSSTPSMKYLSDAEAYRRAGLQAVIQYQAKGCPRTNPTPDREVVTVAAGGWGRAERTIVVPVIRISGSRVVVGKVDARYPDSDTIVLQYKIPLCSIRGMPSPESTP